MKRLLASIGGFLLVSALVLLLLALAVLGLSQIPLTVLCGLFPFLWFLGMLLLWLGIGLEEKPPREVEL
jgi:hypothetical protein